MLRWRPAGRLRMVLHDLILTKDISRSMTALQTAPATSPARAATFAQQRLNMVDSQVRPSDITDRRIIRAMGSVPREAFVPAALQAIAYMDNAVPLGPAARGRALMEPRLLAKLLQLAEIPDGGRILDVGFGTGYGLAVMAAMGLKVHGVEENADLAATARVALEAASPQASPEGSTAPHMITGPASAGLADAGPYDAILVSGSVADVPKALLDQLKSGGRLVAIVGAGPGGKATVWTRSSTAFGKREAFDAGAAPLPGFRAAAGFVF
jgi:protein-L-isoaspartate(D-aspartate) O-methyltransferase